MLKQFIHYLRVLSVMALLVCAVASGLACDHEHVHTCNENGYNYADYPNRNWVERLVAQDSNFLFRDLSLVCAHDVATWMSGKFRYKDQVYCERELFLKGVRAFDMRLDYRTSNGKYYVRHGPLLTFNERYNEIQEEVKTHLPTPDELKKEFMVLYFSYEDNNYTNERVRNTYYEFFRCLHEKYDSTGIEFAEFKRDMTVAEMQGKILLIGEGAYRLLNDIQVDPYGAGGKYTPFIAQAWGYFFSYKNYRDIDGRLNGPLWKSKENNKDKPVNLSLLTDEDWAILKEINTEFVQEHGVWSYDRDDKTKEISNSLINWLSNDSNYPQYTKIQLNSYVWPDAGIDICADEGDTFKEYGVNHLAYCMLRGYYGSYGTIQFDFIGEDWVDDKYTCGNRLLELCINNNFIRLPFVKDIYVGTNNDLLGYDCEYFCEEHCKSNYLEHRIYDSQIGWTTTNMKDGSVSDVIIVKNSTADKTPKKEIQINGITYHLAISEESTDYMYTDLYKRWYYESSPLRNNDGDHEPLLLYYSKNDEDSDSDFKVVTKIVVSHDALTPEYTQVAGYTYSDGTYNSLDLSSIDDIYNIGYACEVHEHTYIPRYVDENYHQEFCTTCNHIKANEPHKKVYVPKSDASHNLVCKACMTTFENNIECKGTLVNGFGTCTDCGNELTESPTVDNDGTMLISNAGQLLAFSSLATNTPTLKAKLTADIDFGDNAEKWVPIGLYYQKPYKGTFDGQGHIIMGIQRSESDSLDVDGLFALTDQAIIMNLGVTDCKFRGDSTGVFIGQDYGTFTHIENCFSNSIAISCVDGIIRRGGDFFGHIRKNAWPLIYNSCVLNNNSNAGVFATRDAIYTFENVYTPYKISGVETTQLTKTQYTSGELCALLNSNVASFNKRNLRHWVTWRQTLGKDTVPTFDLREDRCPTGIDYECNMSNQWGTLVLPFDVAIDNDKPYDFYSISSVSGDQLSLTKLTGTLSAGTPVVVRMSEAAKNAETGKYYLTLADTDSTFNAKGGLTAAAGSLTLTGSYDVKDVTDEAGYIFSNNAFWNIQDIKGENKVKIAPFRAYLAGTISSSNNKAPTCLSISESEENEMALEALEAITEGEAEYYDLSGHRLTELRNGVNIVRCGGRSYKVILNGPTPALTSEGDYSHRSGQQQTLEYVTDEVADETLEPTGAEVLDGALWGE